jgi:hypothetical protein
MGGAADRRLDPLFDKVRVMMMEGTAPAPVFGLEASFYVGDAAAPRLLQEREGAQEVGKRCVSAVSELKEAIEVFFKPTTAAPRSADDFSDFYRALTVLWIRNVDASGTRGGPRAFVAIGNDTNKVGVPLHHVMRGDESVRMEPLNPKVPFTNLQRKAMAAYSTPLVPLMGQAEVTARVTGVIDRARMQRAVFYLQKPIERLAERLLACVPGACAVVVRTIELADGVVITVVEVFCGDA